jgi:hypothetical protein
MIPGQGYRSIRQGKGQQITQSGLPVLIPSVYQEGGVAGPAGYGNGLTRTIPVMGVSGLAAQTNVLRPTTHGGIDNVPAHMIQMKMGGTSDLTNGPGAPIMQGHGHGMKGLGRGLMARNWDVLSGDSATSGQDASEIFHGATRLPVATTLTMPNITATARAGLGAYTNLSPQSLNQRLPSIINDTPQDLNQAQQDQCGAMDSWIGQNQALAVAGLVVLAYLLFKK